MLLSAAFRADQAAEFADERVLYLAGRGSEDSEEARDRDSALRFMRRAQEARDDAARARQLVRLIRAEGMPSAACNGS